VGLPPLKRHDISIEEALTLLAWGTPFTTSDFQAVDGLPSNRSMLEHYERRLAELETSYEQKQVDAFQQSPREGANAEAILAQLNASTDIQSLIFSWQNAKENIAQYGSAILHAEQVLPKIEAASGGHVYASDDFFRGLSLAQGHLWEAIKAGTVTAHAKKDRADQEWQTIPKRWFWDDPQPTCNLGMGWIERNKKFNETGISCWIEVRLERPEIEALRTALLGAEVPAISTAPLKTGAPGRPSSMSFVKVEFHRRRDEGQISSNLKEEAVYLANWLKKEHPSAPRLTPKTIENSIRTEFRGLKPPT